MGGPNALCRLLRAKVPCRLVSKTFEGNRQHYTNHNLYIQGMYNLYNFDRQLVPHYHRDQLIDGELYLLSLEAAASLRPNP